MAMDQKDVSEFLKAITAELKKTQHRAMPDIGTSHRSRREDADITALNAFAKINWNKVNIGLSKFVKTQTNVKSIFEKFGDKDMQRVGRSFSATSKIILDPLNSLSNSLDRLGNVSMTKLERVLAGLPSIGKTIETGIRTINDALSSAELQAVSIQFGQTIDILARPISTFAGVMHDLGSVDTRKTVKTLEALPTIAYLLGAVALFNTDALMSVGENFSTIADNIFGPVSDLGDALQALSAIDVKNALLAVKQLPTLARGVLSAVTKFTSSGLQKAAVKFNKVGDLVFSSLKEFADGLKAIADVSVIETSKTLLFLPMMSGMLVRFMNKFGSAELLKAAEHFREVAETDVFRPIQEFSSALKAIGDVSVLKLYKSLLFLKKMEGMLARTMEQFGSDRLKAAGEKFKERTELISAPLKAFSDAVTSFAEIPIAKSLGTALLLPVFFGTLRATTKLMGDLSGLGKRLQSMKPIIKTLKEIGVMMGDAVGSTFGALGKQLKNIALGSLAIGLIAGAMAVSALSFSLFAGIDWTGVFLGITALTGIALGAAALGASAPVVALGAAVIAALGVALIPAAYAMKIAGEAMNLMADAIVKLAPNLLGLAVAGPGLLLTANALGILAVAMVGFAAATTAGGWLSKLGGNSIVSQVIELGKQADPLNAVADALDRIVASSKQLGTIAVPDQMGGVGRGQTMITAQDQIATAQTETTSQPIVISSPGGNLSQKSSVVNNTTNVSNSIMPDRMAGMMPAAVYSF